MHWNIDKLLKVKEVAERFDVSANTVNRWARRGRIMAIRTPGGEYRIPAEYVQYIAAGGSWACDGLDRTDLRGHTITVEPLTRAMCSRMQLIPELVNQRGAVERQHGRFVKVAVVPGEEITTIEKAARSIAHTYGAEYVGAR